MDLFVEKTEPANQVLLRGDVPLELAEPLESVAEWQPKPVVAEPVAANPVVQSCCEEEFDPKPINRVSSQSTFVPFSGQGYRLGSGN